MIRTLSPKVLINNLSLWLFLWLAYSLSNFNLLESHIAQFQSWTKPYVTPKNLFLCFHFPPFSPIPCCRVAIVGYLVENPVSRCVIQHWMKGQGDCRSVTLVLSTTVWKLKKCKKGLLMKTIKRKSFFEISLTY